VGLGCLKMQTAPSRGPTEGRGREGSSRPRSPSQFTGGYDRGPFNQSCNGCRGNYFFSTFPAFALGAGFGALTTTCVAVIWSAAFV